jgi:hypothetical protein
MIPVGAAGQDDATFQNHCLKRRFTMFRKYALSALLALAGCFVLAGVVTAQTPFQGLQVDLSNGGKASTVYLNEDMPNQMVAKFWVEDHVQKSLDKAIQNAMKGTGAYNVDSRLSLNKSVGPTNLLQNGDIYTSSFLRNNTLTFKVTTGTDGIADPQFKINYDLLAIILIKQGPGGDFSAQGEVRITNLRLDTQNAAADVLKAVDSVIKFFTGKDFIAQAEASILKNQVDISGYLKPLIASINQKLDQGRKAGLKTLTKKVDPKTKRLLITLSK